MHGVEVERDEMSDKEGNEIDGEEELAMLDWRVRAGPRNKGRERSVKRHSCRSETGACTA